MPIAAGFGQRFDPFTGPRRERTTLGLHPHERHLMAQHRLLLASALASLLLLPAAAAAAADDGAAAGAGPTASSTVVDPRISVLKALVPTSLAGLPLDENLVLATGEEMLGLMSSAEVALLQALFAAHEVSAADYAAAATWVSIAGTDDIVLQAHRITGVPAAATTDVWVRILSLNATEPTVSQVVLDGRPVTLMTDAANEAAPPMHMFPAGDVVWMMWADDQMLVQEAMDRVAADAGTPAQEPAG